MSNHLHNPLEVPPVPEGGISEGELLKRLGAIYNEAVVAKELATVRTEQRGESVAGRRGMVRRLGKGW